MKFSSTEKYTKMLANEDIWEKVLAAVEKQISQTSYDTWFKTTTAVYEEGKMKVFAANKFACDWLDSQYLPIISEKVEEITGEAIPIEIRSTEGTSEHQTEERYDDLKEIKDLLKESLEMQKQIVGLLKERL